MHDFVMTRKQANFILEDQRCIKLTVATLELLHLVSQSTKMEISVLRDSDADLIRLILSETKPVEAYGIKGLNNKPWRKTFRNADALSKWLEKQEGNAELHGTSQAD